MIHLDRVTKRYGPILAVDEVSFRVEPGQIVGFVGPNGAGKSTLLKIVSTWLAPTSGRVEVAGFDVVAEPLAVRRALGYLPEHNPLYDGMRVDRFLDFAGRIRGLAGARLAERFDWVVERCGLEPVVGRRIHQCSKGFRQRIGLAAALVHDPPVIVLDEPTHGLDLLQVAAFRELVLELRKDRAILLSNHVLSEVASISDRLVAIHRGRLVIDAPLAELEARAAGSPAGLEGVVVGALEAGGLET